MRLIKVFMHRVILLEVNVPAYDCRHLFLILHNLAGCNEQNLANHRLILDETTL